jgi:hypothetical protein
MACVGQTGKPALPLAITYTGSRPPDPCWAHPPTDDQGPRQARMGSAPKRDPRQGRASRPIASTRPAACIPSVASGQSTSLLTLPSPVAVSRLAPSKLPAINTRSHALGICEEPFPSSPTTNDGCDPEFRSPLATAGFLAVHSLLCLGPTGITSRSLDEFELGDGFTWAGCWNQCSATARDFVTIAQHPPQCDPGLHQVRIPDQAAPRAWVRVSARTARIKILFELYG